MMGDKRGAGRAADDLVTVFCRNNDAVLAFQKQLQIFLLVIPGAFVKIREIAEHRDAQPRQIVERVMQCGAGQWSNRQGHRGMIWPAAAISATCDEP